MGNSNWVWMPHAGHLCVSNQCRFHLNTYLGNGFLVSTVGEYFPDAPLRELNAEMRGVVLEGKGDCRRADYMKKIGFEEIGCDRTYETMVFLAKKSKHDCCPWTMAVASELDMDGYNDPSAAYKGHLAMCDKWAQRSIDELEQERARALQPVDGG